MLQGKAVSVNYNLKKKKIPLIFHHVVNLKVVFLNLTIFLPYHGKILMCLLKSSLLVTAICLTFTTSCSDMFYFSAHFNCSLRLADNHCLTCPGTYTKAPPRTEVWAKIMYNLIPLWWPHVKMVPLLFCKLWWNMSYMKGEVRPFALFFGTIEGNSWREIGRALYYIPRSLSFNIHKGKPMFSFLGTWSNFKIKSKLINQLDFT